MQKTEPIIVEQQFDAPIEIVWNAITNVQHMRQWYFPNIPGFRPELGFETQFLIQNEGRNFTHIWKVTEVIPKKQISYTWNFKEYPGQGLSTFVLEQKDGETRLTLKSFVLESFPKNIPEFERESGVAGWHYLINQNLVKFLSP